MQRAKPEMKTASKSHSLSSAAPNSVCVSKIQRQEEKSKLLKGGISFEETKPP
jgi:hypothetical protein